MLSDLPLYDILVHPCDISLHLNLPVLGLLQGHVPSLNDLIFVVLKLHFFLEGWLHDPCIMSFVSHLTLVISSLQLAKVSLLFKQVRVLLNQKFIVDELILFY